MPELASYLSFFLTIALINAVACLGLNVQWGFTGLFNVGIAGFIAVGAYVSAILTTPVSTGHVGGFGLPVPIGWLGAMLAAGAVAAALGAITLRLRADYLAITTFGVAVAIQQVALNAEWLTGGPFGVAFIPKPLPLESAAPLARSLADLALVAAVTALAYWAIERLTGSPFGRVLRALREDEAAAASLGKSPRRYRVTAFAVGAMLMGLSGALQAHLIGFIAPENYLPTLTFQIWAMLVIGGSGNNRGAVLGAVLVWALWSATGTLFAAILPEALQARAASLRIVVIGALLCLVLLVRPQGLLGARAVISRHVEG
jgi:branched-chain amino acid transport system permease protein